MNWHPHTEKPPEDAPVFTALLARKGDDGEFFLLSCPYFWKDGGWIEEATGKEKEVVMWEKVLWILGVWALLGLIAAILFGMASGERDDG